MRFIRRFFTIAIVLCLVSGVGYAGFTAVTGSDPFAMDEVPDTRALPGYELVHHPQLAGLVDVTTAVEPDEDWDAQWWLDSVRIRSRLVGESIEFDVEVDSDSYDTDISDTFLNLLAAEGFTSLE